MTKTNLCFSEVVDVVLCYRLELGQALNNLNTSYNKLFEKMLEQCFRHDQEKEKEFDDRMHTTNEALAIALEKQPEFEKRIAHLENIVLAKDGELRT